MSHASADRPEDRDVAQLAAYAAAAATCADRYAKAFYSMTKDADEKMICCVHGAEDMGHYMAAADLLRELGRDLGDVVVRPIGERGLAAADALAATDAWPSRAAFSALFERALLASLEALAKSARPKIAKVAAAAIAHEARHVAEGTRILRAICKSPEGRAQADAAARRLFPAALAVVLDDAARRAFADAAERELRELGITLAGADAGA